MIRSASPVPVRDVVGYPDWVKNDRYDVIAKAPAGTTAARRQEMIRALFTDRMKLVGHVEQREMDGFALVVARSDGRLGPQLKPSTLDCTPRPAGDQPLPPAPVDAANRCGLSTDTTSIASGSITMDRLARALEGEAGDVVINRTGLDGAFALTLKYSESRGAGNRSSTAATDVPEIFTALQEQLGLKLQRVKTVQPVFVVDRIERPTEN
jgi:uncharacterized protein (TIGR03435 family)